MQRSLSASQLTCHSVRRFVARVAGLTASLIFLTAPAWGQEQPRIEPLGSTEGIKIRRFPHASDDGSVVVGFQFDCQPVAVWTAATGATDFAETPEGTCVNLDAGRIRVSGNGAVVAGGFSYTDREDRSGDEAWQWTPETGFTFLGDLSPCDFTCSETGTEHFQSSAQGLSRDGSVIVGYADNISGNFEAFRWTSAGGMVGLNSLPGGSGSLAFGVSADGSVVVGSSVSSQGGQAFRWEAGVMTGLGDLSGGQFGSSATAVSADGSTVAGQGTTAAGTEAFRWTAQTGMQPLGNVPGGSFFSSRANAVSGDGSIVVGDGLILGENSSRNEPFIWTEAGGMRLLKDVLAEQGVDLTGWSLSSATSISADGRVIVGEGGGPGGFFGGWRVVLGESVHRWINPAGGSYDVAENWQPASVPGPGSTLMFDIPGTYTVTAPALVGKTAAERRAERSVVDEGTVDFAFDVQNFTSTSFTNPSLSVSFGATAKIVSGNATVQHAVVGYGTETDPARISRLQVFNEGTLVDGKGDLIVGLQGRGEVFVAAGRLRARDAWVGGGPPPLTATAGGLGEVIVGNGGSFDMERLFVGNHAKGAFTVEEGGAVTTVQADVGQVVPSEGNPSVLQVTGAGASGSRSRLFVTDTVFVGATGIGHLLVKDGAEVTAGVVRAGGSAPFSFIHVSGVEAEHRATLDANRFRLENDASLLVDKGGLARAEQFVASNRGAGVLIDGVEAVRRPELLITSADFSGRCLIGTTSGRGGSFSVMHGGYARCDQMEVGDVGEGSLTVGFPNEPGADSVVVSGVLKLGEGGPGNLLMFGGVVDALDVRRNPPNDLADVVVNSAGTIEGTGKLVGKVLSVGTISPGVEVTAQPPAPALRLSGNTASKHAEEATRSAVGGTLVIEGTFTQEQGGTLVLPIAGPDAAQQGRLVVQPVEGIPSLSGSATLSGTLRLAFEDGYAPRQGDTFSLVEAAATAGSFETVEVAGLAPGFQFEVDAAVSGTVMLTALSDGVAVSSEEEPHGPGAPPTVVLHSNVPNPSDGATEVAFTLPQPSDVRLVVYDLLGREVAVLAEGPRTAGTHHAVFRAEGLPSGVYVYRLEAGAFVQSRRMIVVK